MGEFTACILTLQCDSPAKTCPEIKALPYEAVGPNLRAARTNAEGSGWTRRDSIGEWFCPACSALEEGSDG